MNRPIYETGEDKLNEQKVAEQIVAARPVMLQKLPPRHAMDYAAVGDNGIKFFLEIKCRTFEKAKYPTTMCGMDKVLYAVFVRASVSALRREVVFVRAVDGRISIYFDE